LKQRPFHPLKPQQQSDEVSMNVVYVYVKVLYDDAYALTHQYERQAAGDAQAVDEVQAAENALVADDAVLADNEVVVRACDISD
jgi:hypothetical protein